MKIIAILFGLSLLMGCGVKKQEPASAPSNVQAGENNLPKGVLFSANKKFLVRPSVEQIQVGDESNEYAFKMNYALTTSELEPVSDTYKVSVIYGMPSMPQMKIKPATVVWANPGLLSVTYHIDMAQDWRMVLKILSPEGVEIDSITYNYYIPE